jgi:hypothetical protein
VQQRQWLTGAEQRVEFAGLIERIEIVVAADMDRAESSGHHMLLLSRIVGRINVSNA